MTINPFARIATMGWMAWLATLLATGCLCGAIAYWGMQLLAPRAPIAPVASGPVLRERPDLSAPGALFGSPRRQEVAAAPTLGNVQVLGVIAAGSRGSAILIVDGKPARTYGVGELIGPGQRIRAVRGAMVLIDDNGRQAEVAAPPAGSTAILTSGAGKPRQPGDPMSNQTPFPSPGSAPGAPSVSMGAPASGMPGATSVGGVGVSPMPQPASGPSPAPLSPNMSPPAAPGPYQ